MQRDPATETDPADAVDQRRSVEPDPGRADRTAAPLEANEADVADQDVEVPIDDEDEHDS